MEIYLYVRITDLSSYSFKIIAKMYFRILTAQKAKFSIKDFLSKCNQIRSF